MPRPAHRRGDIHKARSRGVEAEARSDVLAEPNVYDIDDLGAGKRFVMNPIQGGDLTSYPPGEDLKFEQQ